MHVDTIEGASVCTHKLVIWIDSVTDGNFQRKRWEMRGEGGLREIWEGV
jgi:hypothetical protein